MFSEKYMKIIDEIEDGKTCNEICLSLGISRKQLYYYMQSLKNEGIDFTRKYYSNGVIKYELDNKNNLKQEENSINLITRTSSDFEKFIVFSDSHYGNENEMEDLHNRMFEYAVKNNIHILFCCGDILDGTYTKGIKNRSRDEVIDQIINFLEKFPFDKNITTIGVLGDHDVSILSIYGINLKTLLDNKRHDIVFGGYNNTNVNIKNDNIVLYHHLNGGNILPKASPIILKGHTHNYSSIKREDGTVDINVPSTSGIMDILPSALIMELSFKYGFISEASIRQLLFLDKEYVVSNNRYEFNKKTHDRNIQIKNEEHFYPERGLEELLEYNKNKVLSKKKESGYINLWKNSQNS